jgi:16S rRNA (adenine1518-N6/adenine1519-N6)-dimethyltransferase
MRVAARKRFGQHFLHDPAVIRRIIAAVDPAPADNLVEIGGGMGALTAPLLERVDTLHVIEVDTRLATELERLGKSRGQPLTTELVVHHADALDFDFMRLAAPERKLRVVGNLPYNISTPLLFRLLGLKGAILDLHLMLQKEVVTRMTAAPGSKDYGRLTVMLAAWADIERCFDIGPGAFVPAPKVWSTFVRIVPRADPRFVIADEARFASLVARLFSMRRKTIGRSLKGRATAPAIAAAGSDPRARPENLAPAEFARLAELCG